MVHLPGRRVLHGVGLAAARARAAQLSFAGEVVVTSRAKIAELTAVDGTVLIPYAGEQRTVQELRAQNATLTAEDYALIRRALGGGKRGRTRARALLPLQCPSCAARLTHFEPARRPPYFAATANDSPHGAQCERAELEGPATASQQSMERDDDDAAAVVATELAAELAAEAAEHEPKENAPADATGPGAVYVIEEAGEDASDSAALRARLGLPPDATRVAHQPTGEHERALPDARALLTKALNRSIASHSQVRFRGQHYAVVSAAELHRHEDGELVAVYGRIWQGRWSEASGRLTLVAAPRTVQVWATAAVPRLVLGISPGEPVPPPVLRKPVPFIAFGKLKKLAEVCGIPVVRREYLVLLQPLDLAATRTRPSHTRSLSDLTDELDELLSSPLSVHPAHCVSAEAALVQAFSAGPEPASC